MSLPAGSPMSAVVDALAADIPAGAYVNFGIGLPGRVAAALDPTREIVVHSENGILGVGAPPPPGSEDWNLIDPGKSPVTLVTGGAFVDHVDSFAIIRGGHLDIAVLGAFEVSAQGDLANWTAGGMPAVGGAMDLAVGAKEVWILMRHRSQDGRSKLVERCTLPLTARRCVTRVYTDEGVFVPTGTAFRTQRTWPTGLTE